MNVSLGKLDTQFASPIKEEEPMAHQSTTSEHQLDDFARHIEALQHQHQQVAYALCIERLARDSGLLSSRRHRFPGLRRIGHWFTERRNRVVRIDKGVGDEPQVIVITASSDTEGEEVSDG